MGMTFNQETQTFHIGNEWISYVFKILENGQLGQLYYGKAITNRESFDHMLQMRSCILAPCAFKNNLSFSLELIKQEYPSYGTGDYREPAYQIRDLKGSRISDFKYVSHRILEGKEGLEGLPATYGTKEEVSTLEVTLYDALAELELKLIYSVFKALPVITRSVKFTNKGEQEAYIERALSMSVDLYDAEFEMVQLDGAWSRERHVHTRKLQYGVQSIASSRGASSANHNPFIALKREEATEHIGEVYGFSLLYSGNFLGQVQVDSYDVTRVSMGINPFEFEWCLESGETFTTPEVAMVYSDKGLNGMSQAYHDLYRNNLIRGRFKSETRPILINNWEATYFDFTEEKILDLAGKAKELGVELFVLDDGWFGKRDNDHTSLGDWKSYLEKLPNGVEGLAKKVTDLGIAFGLWFEPEMVNEISELYEAHPEWVISTPGRDKTYGRNQLVLDYTNDEVVDFIFEMMAKVLKAAPISYVKWDMNRNITEAFSKHLPAKQQKEFFHRYILGVYQLYERLIAEFPHILFESCASGGARFDAGMLYYAPQAWASDNTDAIERLKIQTGTSMVYPLSSIGSHVSAIPNHQVLRRTSLETRANVAYFGTFGYELDITKMPQEELEIVRAQIVFFKANRELIHGGDFYRLETGARGIYSWMVVSKDKEKAIIGYYKVFATPNPGLKKVQLKGLLEGEAYYCAQRNQTFYGDELMNYGFQYEIGFTGVLQGEDFKGVYDPGVDKGDFTSWCYVLEKKDR